MSCLSTSAAQEGLLDNEVSGVPGVPVAPAGSRRFFWRVVTPLVTLGLMCFIGFRHATSVRQKARGFVTLEDRDIPSSIPQRMSLQRRFHMLCRPRK